MADDPAFLFYAGDYLRDTQCLSEPSQVAYDRIMCEHMRNICITQERLNFFTKKLSPENKEEVLSVLKKIEGGFQILWVADSILKRRAYSDSRRKNRIGATKPKPKRQKKSYDTHMENENENEDINTKGNKNKTENNTHQSCISVYNDFILKQTGASAMIDGREGKAMKTIIQYLLKQDKINGDKAQLIEGWKWILNNWERVDDFTRKRMKLSQIQNELTNIIGQIKNGASQTKSERISKANADKLDELLKPNG